MRDLREQIMALIGWRDIADAPPIGTVAVLYFPKDGYDDAEYGEGLDYRYRLAMYRRTPLGDGWHDQGTNHDSFENAEPSGIGMATRYLPLPNPENAHD